VLRLAAVLPAAPGVVLDRQLELGNRPLAGHDGVDPMASEVVGCRLQLPDRAFQRNDRFPQAGLALESFEGDIAVLAIRPVRDGKVKLAKRLVESLDRLGPVAAEIMWSFFQLLYGALESSYRPADPRMGVGRRGDSVWGN